MSNVRGRTLKPVPETGVRTVFRTIHGYRRAVRMAGDGPTLLLLHGIGDDSSTWAEIIPHLASTHTVIAPDLLGHGRSDKPRADYSVAAYANGMRDLLAALGVARVTILGHSLGGGVAAQFAYQFPQMVDRLILVSAGGVAKEVHPLLRLSSVPVLNEALKLLRLPGALPAVRLIGTVHDQIRGTGLPLGAALHDTADLTRILAGLAEPTAHAAYLRTLRAVMDWRGQVVTMLDRCYLTENVPVQLIWGDRDVVIPVDHAYLAHAALPGSHLEIFRGAGHFPFRDDPVRFLRTVETFLSATRPLEFDPTTWQRLLINGPTEYAITGTPATREALCEAIESDERSAT